MKKGNRPRMVVTGILCGILVLGVVLLGMYFWNGYREKKKQEELAKQVVDQEEIEAPKETNPIDFDSLWALNPDVYAWIYIPGTNISYPVLQHPDDNTYYLEHTIEGEKKRPGTIYSENYNSKDFTDFNTILYGHNMHSNGTMFYELHNYENADFVEQNRQIIIYLPDRRLTYQIVAVAVTDNSHLMYKYRNFNDEGKDAFLAMLSDAGTKGEYFDASWHGTRDSRLLTLSTCVYRHDDQRFLVVGELTDETELAPKEPAAETEPAGAAGADAAGRTSLPEESGTGAAE